MARGYDRQQQRTQDIMAMGRELGRRSRSRCELCGERTSLEIVEVPPLPEHPEPEAALMVCARCRPAVEGTRLQGEPDTWRFLTEAIWGTLPPAQVVAVRTTRRLSAQGVDWARVALDGLFLDPEIEARV